MGTRRSRRTAFSSSAIAGILGKSSLNSHDLVTLFLRYTTARRENGMSAAFRIYADLCGPSVADVGGGGRPTGKSDLSVRVGANKIYQRTDKALLNLRLQHRGLSAKLAGGKDGEDVRGGARRGGGSAHRLQLTLCLLANVGICGQSRPDAVAQRSNIHIVWGYSVGVRNEGGYCSCPEACGGGEGGGGNW